MAFLYSRIPASADDVIRLIDFRGINHGMSPVPRNVLENFERLAASRIVRWLKGSGHVWISGVITRREYLRQRNNGLFRATALLEAATTHKSLPTGDERLTVCIFLFRVRRLKSALDNF